MVRHRLASAFFFLGFAAALPSLISCGTPAVPEPPSLYLPQPPTDLTVMRTGNDVHLHWTMPQRATDKAPLKGDQTAHICRRVADGPCETAGDAAFTLGVPADFTDHLPAALASGPPQLLTYTVELQNHRGRTAGPSNAAYSASGAAPEQMTSLAAGIRANGVLLHWQPAQNAGSLIRITRTLDQPKGKSQKASSAELRKGAEVAPQQTLETSYPAQHDPGRSLDPDAVFDATYQYTVQRIAKLNLSGHHIEVASASSETITVHTQDTFPPASPSGLAAVASPEEHIIDLSWSPNGESDLAGYAVYRREAASSVPAERISPAQPVAGPSFRDTKAQPGKLYEYSVSAIDQDKNESARSPEVEASLPQQP